MSKWPRKARKPFRQPFPSLLVPLQWFRPESNELGLSVLPTRLPVSNLRGSAVRKSGSVRKYPKDSFRGTTKLYRVQGLIDSTDVSRHNELSADSLPRNWVGERHDSANTFRLEFAEALRDKPTLAVSRNFVQKDQSPELGGVSVTPRKNVGQHLVRSGVREHRHTSKTATPVKTESEPVGRKGSGVVVTDNELFRDRRPHRVNVKLRSPNLLIRSAEHHLPLTPPLTSLGHLLDHSVYHKHRFSFPIVRVDVTFFEEPAVQAAKAAHWGAVHIAPGLRH